MDLQARDMESTVYVEPKRPTVTSDKKTTKVFYITTKVKDCCVVCKAGRQAGRQASPTCTCLQVIPGIPAQQEGGICQEEQAVPQLLEVRALC